MKAIGITIRRMGRWAAAACLCLWGVAATAQPLRANPVLVEGIYHIEHPENEAQLARQSLAWLQEAEAEFAPRLPAGDDPIYIVIAGSLAQFDAIAGRLGDPSVGGIARAADSLIVIKSPNMQRQGHRYREVLRHELVHILLYRNTDTDNLPRWLNEGIAMMLAGEHVWEGPSMIAMMYMRGQIMSYPDLQMVLAGSPGEMAFGHAYAQSLSMSRFLHNHLGEETFWELVLRHDEAIFPVLLLEYTGWYPYDFWEAWKRSLWAVALVVSLLSGFGIFQAAALLALLAWWRKRADRLRRLAAMEAAEAEADALLLPSEVLPDGELYDWEIDNEDAADDWKR